MRYIVFFLSIFFVLGAKAQREYHAFDVYQNLIVPPNGIWVSENIFLDDAEVMNSHYLEYLHFLAQDSSEQALIDAYPDTAIFGTRHLKKMLSEERAYYKKKGNKHIPLRTLLHEEKNEPTHKHHWWNYFSYHGTRHHPVVGITYEQALAYCKWRSEFVTMLFNNVLSKKKKYAEFKDKAVRFEFALPDVAVWEKVAREIRTDSTPQLNVGKNLGDSAAEPEFVYSNSPTKSGFYNLIGNVAEMTAEKGVSKGGSYLHDLNECSFQKSISFEKPERWLGFRCQCKVFISSK